ncbi:hypothetical protein EYR40_002120 [Pleurotus pulmonarius]|nr:hypothetical protein EYR40_002120 [Pleurotus pulmonarius]
MSLEELPVELLQAILKELRPRDLAILSSISRPIYPVAMCELYTFITLKKKKQSRLLAKSLKHRPSKASFIKYLIVESSITADNDAVKALPDIVKYLDQLRHLEITAEETSTKRLNTVIRGLKTEQLTHLTLLTDLQPIGDLVDFIVGRNPNLRELRLSPSAVCGDQTPALALPKLEEFVGPSWCFSRHTVAMPLLQACIAWDLETSVEDTKDLIATLAVSCSGSLKVLCCSKAGPCEELVEAIASTFPDILGLEISSSVIMDSPSTALRLAESLAKMKKLIALSFNPSLITFLLWGVLVKGQRSLGARREELSKWEMSSVETKLTKLSFVHVIERPQNAPGDDAGTTTCITWGFPEETQASSTYTLTSDAGTTTDPVPTPGGSSHTHADTSSTSSSTSDAGTTTDRVPTPGGGSSTSTITTWY